MNSDHSAGDPAQEKAYIDAIYKNNPPDYIGDVITIAQCDSLKVQAVLKAPYSENSDDFEGKFLISDNKKRFDHWTRHYSKEVKNYIADNIEDQSAEFSMENAKVGVVGYNYDAVANGNTPFVIQPVNHLITVAFNRMLAMERITRDTSSTAHQLWQNCFSHAVNGSIQVMQFINPSQLFVEIGLVTSDNFVPITKKLTSTSVYALRNKGELLKTCGLESGLNWRNDVVETNQKGVVEIDLLSGVVAGLKRKFPMPDWDSKTDQLEVKMSSYVLQTLHLNSSILGYCKLPYTKAQLEAELHGQVSGGLDHSKLEFIKVSECDKVIEQHSESTAWHGSAMARLKIISDHFK